MLAGQHLPDGLEGLDTSILTSSRSVTGPYGQAKADYDAATQAARARAQADAARRTAEAQRRGAVIAQLGVTVETDRMTGELLLTVDQAARLAARLED